MNSIQLKNFGGKDRGWKFNQEALELLVKHINWDNATTSSEIYSGFYAGLVANCRVRQEVIDFTFEQVCDWVDEISKEVIKEVMDAIAENQKYKTWLQEAHEKIRQELAPLNKKKVVKKKLEVK